MTGGASGPEAGGWIAGGAGGSYEGAGGAAGGSGVTGAAPVTGSGGGDAGVSGATASLGISSGLGDSGEGGVRSSMETTSSDSGIVWQSSLLSAGMLSTSRTKHHIPQNDYSYGLVMCVATTRLSRPR